MDVWLLVINLEVTDVTVSLTGKEEEVGVVIVEGHQNTRGGIDVGSDDGGLEVAGVEDVVGTVRGLGETNAEDGSLLSEPDSTGSLDTGMSVGLRGDGSLTGVEDADLLVLGGGNDEGTIVVPVNTLNNVGVSSDGVLGVSALDVPNLDGVVGGGGSNDVVSGGVEVDGSDLSLVADKGLDGVNEALGKTTIGDSPQTTVTILRNGGDEVVVEAGEGDVEDLALVSGDEGGVTTELSSLVVGENSERATTATLPNGSYKLVASSDLVGVPGTSGNLNTIKGVLTLLGVAEDVSELA